MAQILMNKIGSDASGSLGHRLEALTICFEVERNAGIIKFDTVYSYSVAKVTLNRSKIQPFRAVAKGPMF